MNTKNAALTCIAGQTQLHVVRPTGFEVSDEAMARVGFTHWPLVDAVIHESFEAFLTYRQSHPGRLLAFGPRGTVHFQLFQYQSSDYLLHGAEVGGLSAAMLAEADHSLYIPMHSAHVRSLNLAVSASISVYEGLRQLLHTSKVLN